MPGASCAAAAAAAAAHATPSPAGENATPSLVMIEAAAAAASSNSSASPGDAAAMAHRSSEILPGQSPALVSQDSGATPSGSASSSVAGVGSSEETKDPKLECYVLDFGRAFPPQVRFRACCVPCLRSSVRGNSCFAPDICGSGPFTHC